MPLDKTSNFRRRVKSRAGCQTCKARRVKCDEKLPQCSGCEKRGQQCPGYNKGLKWSDKYEMLLPIELRGEEPPTETHLPWFLEGATRLEAAIASANLTACTSVPASFSVTDDLRGDWAENSPEDSGDTSFHVPSSSLGMWSEKGYLEETTYPSPYVHTEPESDRLLRYYFSRVCGILSIFDSSMNPLRSLVQGLIPSSSALLNSVLAMSAAHLHHREKHRSRYALKYRTQAISQLSWGISQATNDSDNALSALSHSNATGLILSAIILGMTSTWHDVSSPDLVHLKGARSLFKKWITSRGTGPARLTLGHPQTMFLVGVMAFWESLASFHVNQNLANVDYLWDVWNSQSCAEIEGCRSHPPTGISTPLFIHLAQVGTLSRQIHLLDKLGHLSGTPVHEGEMYHSLLGQARKIEVSVRSFVVLSADQIQDTGDAFTPPTHLETIGKVYQLSILLEVYRLFPDLLSLDSSWAQGYFRHILVTLAINILTLLATIAHTSRTKAIQVFPLIVAGSALQADPDRLVDVPLLPLTYQDPIQGIMSLFSQDTSINHWRSVVMQNIKELHDYVGLDSVGHAKQLVEGVWMRADVNPQQTFVSWMDVMMEENLSTFFG